MKDTDCKVVLHLLGFIVISRCCCDLRYIMRCSVTAKTQRIPCIWRKQTYLEVAPDGLRYRMRAYIFIGRARKKLGNEAIRQ